MAINESQTKEVLQMNLEGSKNKEISLKIGISVHAVKRVLKKNNRKSNTGCITSSEKLMIFKLHSDGLTHKEICSKVPQSIHIITRVLAENNLKPNNFRLESRRELYTKTLSKTKGNRKEASVLLGINYGTFTAQLSTLGLTERCNSVEEFRSEYNEYLSRGLTYKDISQLTGITMSLVTSRCMSLGIKEKVRTFNSNRMMNENKFAKHTNESDYWLGFIMADGHLHNDGFMVQLMQHNENSRILVKYLRFLNADLKLQYYKTEHGCRRVVSFSNKEVHSYLKGLGLEENKSRNLHYTRELNWSIVRGYFDGDGCITYSTSTSGKKSYMAKFTSNSILWINQLEKFITKETGIKEMRVSEKMGTLSNFPSYDLNIRNTDLIKLFEKMYKNTDLFLPSKYNRFIKHIKMKI